MSLSSNEKVDFIQQPVVDKLIERMRERNDQKCSYYLSLTKNFCVLLKIERITRQSIFQNKLIQNDFEVKVYTSDFKNEDNLVYTEDISNEIV